MSKIALTPNASGTGVFTISSPATSTDRTLTLPDEAGTVLTSASSLASANLTGSVPSSAMPAGSVLQVLQTVKTDTFSTTSTTMTDITGLSVSITPTSAASKILVFMNASIGGGNASDVNHVGVQIVRGSTAIFVGDARGTRMQATGVVNTGLVGQMFHPNTVYLDSPATTSAITYKLQIKTTTASYTANVNRSGRDADDAIGYDGTGTSGITVMEIAG